MGKTHAIALDPDQFAAVFGHREPAGHSRTRSCTVCGGWHSLDALWPHNCRPEAPPRSNLTAPRLAPKFEPFKPSHFTDDVISDPRAKRDYMERKGLVEYDLGVAPDAEPTDQEWEQGFVTDFKRAAQMDPLAIEPVDVIGRTDLEGAAEIDVAEIEVFK